MRVAKHWGWCPVDLLHPRDRNIPNPPTTGLEHVADAIAVHVAGIDANVAGVVDAPGGIDWDSHHVTAATGVTPPTTLTGRIRLEPGVEEDEIAGLEPGQVSVLPLEDPLLLGLPHLRFGADRDVEIALALQGVAGKPGTVGAHRRRFFGGHVDIGDPTPVVFRADHRGDVGRQRGNVGRGAGRGGGGNAFPHRCEWWNLTPSTAGADRPDREVAGDPRDRPGSRHRRPDCAGCCRGEFGWY